MSRARQACFAACADSLAGRWCPCQPPRHEYPETAEEALSRPPKQPEPPVMTPEEIERELRREWWLHHGHPIHALYGDDGEMQCAMCLRDYKRDPMADLKQAVFVARLQRGARYAAAGRTDR